MEVESIAKPVKYRGRILLITLSQPGYQEHSINGSIRFWPDFLESPFSRVKSLKMFHRNVMASVNVCKSLPLASSLVTLVLKKLKLMTSVQSLYDVVIFELPPRLFYVTGSSLVRGEIHPGTVLDTYVCIEVSQCTTQDTPGREFVER